MKELRCCIKYYPSELEQYLFDDINKSFHKNHKLTHEEFFTIIAWKRKASAIKIARGWKGLDVESITGEIYCKSDDKDKLDILDNISGIGVAIASAILTVCYPEKFTILDYRALNSLRKKESDRCSDANFPKKAEYFKISDYVKYNNICKDVWVKYCSSLRDFDRALWAMDWYEGENGLLDVVEAYGKTLKGI